MGSVFSLAVEPFLVRFNCAAAEYLELFFAVAAAVAAVALVGAEVLLKSLTNKKLLPDVIEERVLGEMEEMTINTEKSALKRIKLLNKLF